MAEGQWIHEIATTQSGKETLKMTKRINRMKNDNQWCSFVFYKQFFWIFALTGLGPIRIA